MTPFPIFDKMLQFTQSNVEKAQIKFNQSNNCPMQNSTNYSNNPDSMLITNVSNVSKNAKIITKIKKTSRKQHINNDGPVSAFK
jgi:hypothetical protein